jgi:hypothetical protein
MMRAVADVNVLISGLIDPGGIPGQVLDQWRAERFLIVTSEAILDEFRLVAARPRLRKYGLTASRVAQLLRAIRQFAIVVAGDAEVRAVSGDADDDKFIACALAGAADYIVTGDDHLLALREYNDIAIIPPKAFIAVLR